MQGVSRGQEIGRVGHAARDATIVTAFLLVAIYGGSGGMVHFDWALLGYAGASVAAVWGIAFQTARFWRRDASAFYGRALLAALRRPRQVVEAARHGARDLVGQRFIARRHVGRWLAHMLLSWGTLASFAVTVPLVWGWIRFEAGDGPLYRVLMWSLPVGVFAVDGAVGWLVFHVLHVAGVAVVLGGLYFLTARIRHRREPGAAAVFHLGPLALLLAVALTGLALPLAAERSARVFAVAAAVHEITVIALLVALPFGKLIHIFVRPLQIGARLVRGSAPPDACVRCAAPLAVAAQIDAVERSLAGRGLDFNHRARVCPLCRRRELATIHAGLLGAQFQPRVVAGRDAPSLREVA